jgi:hypothetical protein
MSNTDLRDSFAAHALGGLIAEGRFAAIRDTAGRDTLDNEDSQSAIAMLCQDAAMIAEVMVRTLRQRAQ